MSGLRDVDIMGGEPLEAGRTHSSFHCWCVSNRRISERAFLLFTILIIIVVVKVSSHFLYCVNTKLCPARGRGINSSLLLLTVGISRLQLFEQMRHVSGFRGRAYSGSGWLCVGQAFARKEGSSSMHWWAPFKHLRIAELGTFCAVGGQCVCTYTCC